MGPALLTVGFLLASLGGLTNSDCALCTLPEMISVLVGAALVFVGAAVSLFRRDRRALGRSFAVVAVTATALFVAMLVRFVWVPPLIWCPPHVGEGGLPVPDGWAGVACRRSS